MDTRMDTKMGSPYDGVARSETHNSKASHAAVKSGLPQRGGIYPRF